MRGRHESHPAWPQRTLNLPMISWRRRNSSSSAQSSGGRKPGPARQLYLPIFVGLAQGGNVLVSKQVTGVMLEFPEGQLRAEADMIYARLLHMISPTEIRAVRALLTKMSGNLESGSEDMPPR